VTTDYTMNSSCLFLLSAVLAYLGVTISFHVTGSHTAIGSRLVMEYIPDGLSKEQWALIKKKVIYISIFHFDILNSWMQEADDLKLKDNGALGVKKFKSRSFEAWHKAGAKHLFPVDPKDAKYEERPYMQRRNGDWEGNDLKQLGLTGQGQGAASQRLNIDDMYEGLKKSGKL
jgi:hypothetical protein